MKPEDIQFGDWGRMFLGENPISFFIEVILRVLIIYFILIVSIRFLGKRMAAQLSRNEMIAMVVLAGAIGVPLQVPDKGLLPPIIIAILVVLIGRGVARIAFHDQKFEHITQDNTCILVQNATLMLDNMKQTRITPERLFAELRSEGIMHLGEVKRLYIEANGSFTLVKDENPEPGLTVLPDWDTEFRDAQMKLGGKVCKKCGKHQEEKEKASGKCEKCENEVWMNAVI